MTEGDERESVPPDEGDGRPSCVAAVPLADCGHPRPFCRGLCRSCYRKLNEADVLPPIAMGPRPRHPLRRWLATLDNGTLVLLAGWIAEIQGGGK